MKRVVSSPTVPTLKPKNLEMVAETRGTMGAKTRQAHGRATTIKRDTFHDGSSKTSIHKRQTFLLPTVYEDNSDLVS
jgi:hypothetical protein